MPPILPGGTDLGGLFGIEMAAEKATGALALTAAELSKVTTDLQKSGAAADAAMSKLAGGTESVVPHTKKLVTEQERAVESSRKLEAATAKLNERLEVAHARNLQAAQQAFGMAAAGAVAFGSGLYHVATALAEASTEAERTERSLRVLGPAYEAVSHATNDTLGPQEAFRLQQRLLEAGLHTTAEELGNIAGAAREHARVLGISASEATEKLTSALIRGSTGGLRPFGLAVEHNASRSQNWHNVLGQLNTRMHETGVSARTAGEEMARSERELGEATNRLGRSVAELIHLRGMLDGLTRFITGAGYDDAAANDNARAQAEFLLQDQTEYAAAVAHTAATFHGLTVELPAFNQLSREGVRNLTSDLTHAHTAQEAQATIANANRLAATQAQTAALHAQNEAAQAAVTLRANDREADELGNHHGSGGGRHQDDPERIRHTIVELEALRNRLDGLGLQLAHVDQLQGEHTLHYLERVKRMREEAIAAQTVINEAAERQAHAMEEYTRQANAWVDSQITELQKLERARTDDENEERRLEVAHNHEIARHSLKLQMAAQWRETLHMNQTTEESVTSASIEAWGMVTGAFKQHLAAFISGKETMGEALKGMLSDVLLNIATSSAVKALESQAAAIFAAASEDWPGAAKFEAAALAWAGVAVATGFGASAMMRSSAGSGASAGGGSGSSGPRSPSSAGGGGSASGGNMTLVFNQSGIFDGKGARGMVADTLDDMSRNNAFPVSVRQLRSGARR